MKKIQNPARFARFPLAGAALSMVLFTACALHAQNYPYSLLQVSGVTLPSGEGQIPGTPLPLGATQDPAPLSIFPTEPVPELISSNPRQMREYLRESARGIQTDIALANLATVKAQSAGVKKLAEAVLAEQNEKYSQLQTLAQRSGVKLGTAAGAKDDIARLQQADGAQFDRAYTALLLERDVKCINHAEQAAQAIRQPDVAAFAVASLPPLRNEVRRAEYAARSVGVDQGTVAGILNALPGEDKGIALNADKSVASR